MSTFIKLYRSTIDHELLANDNNAYILFTKLLLRVDWKTGQLRTGRFKVSEFSNLNPNTAYATLKRLEKAKMITTKSSNKSTLITVLNWKKFQGESDDDNNQTTTRQQPDNTNNKNRRSNNKIYIKKFQSKDLEEAFKYFYVMRKQIKKPMTEKAQELIISRLEKLYPNSPSMQVKSLEQSIENCWMTVYPVKNTQFGQKTPEPPRQNILSEKEREKGRARIKEIRENILNKNKG